MVLTNLIRVMVGKTEEPILHVCGWVNGQTVIAIARSYYRIICGSRLPSPLWDREPDLESGLSLGLAE